MMDIHEDHVRAAWVHFSIDHNLGDRQFMQIPIVRGSAEDFHSRPSEYFIYASYRREFEVIDGIQMWRIVGGIPGTNVKDVEVVRWSCRSNT